METIGRTSGLRVRGFISSRGFRASSLAWHACGWLSKLWTIILTTTHVFMLQVVGFPRLVESRALRGLHVAPHPANL